MITTQGIPGGPPDLVFRPVAQVSPGADAVLLDTGVFGVPATVIIEIWVAASANANTVGIYVARRNAANAADADLAFGSLQQAALAGPNGLWFEPVGSTPFAVGLYTISRNELAAGERVVVRVGAPTAALETWQAMADLWVMQQVIK